MDHELPVHSSRMNFLETDQKRVDIGLKKPKEVLVSICAQRVKITNLDYKKIYFNFQHVSYLGQTVKI